MTTSKFFIVLIILVILFSILCWFVGRPDKPVVTPTMIPTTMTPTKTVIPTETPTKTLSPPTITPTSTKTPTPTPILLEVRTGYKDGWLHYRYGPSLKYYPQWKEKQGAVKEGTKLKFLECAGTKFPWVKVIYNNINGYVYGKYLNMDVCFNRQLNPQ